VRRNEGTRSIARLARMNGKPERSFWLLAIATFALLVGLNYFPVLLGRIHFRATSFCDIPMGKAK